MRKIGLLFTLTLLSTMLMPSAQHLSALTGADWKAGRIIDDVVFTNRDSMSVAQIQEFLNAKVPSCDTNGVKFTSRQKPGGGYYTRAEWGALNGNPAPFTCLRDFYEVPKTSPGPGVPANNYGGAAIPAGAISAAQMIYDAAQTYTISPKVLLTTIQKESAGPLTVDEWPYLSQYTYAMGAQCPDGPDGAQCDPNYSGFSIQIRESARLMRYYLNNMNQPWWSYKEPGTNFIYWNVTTATYINSSGQSVPCGGANVNIETMATAALYTYTPYQPNQAALTYLNTAVPSGTGFDSRCAAYGNRNFWRIFSNWFGTTVGSPLVVAPSSPTYYLISNNKKFAIPNGDILYAYGLEKTPLTVVSDNYLSAVADGGMLSTIFTVPGDGTVFLADGGKKHGISSGTYCVRWGLACGDLNVQKEIGRDIADIMPNGGVLRELMGYKGAIYEMENGKKKPFLSLQAMLERGYTYANAIGIINYTNAVRPMGISLPENNSFLKFASSSAIYFYSQDKFYSMADYETLKNWLPSSKKVTLDPVSDYNSTAPAIETSLVSLISVGDGREYLMDGGAKVDITDVATDWPAPVSIPSLATYIQSTPTKKTLSEQSTLRLANGAIYKVGLDSKQPFASVEDYFSLGFGTDNITQLTTNSLRGIPAGKLLMREGSLFKLSGSDTIFVVGKDNVRYSLTSLAQIQQFAFSTSMVPNVNQLTLDSYPSDGLLISLIYDGTSYFVINGGKKITVPTDLVSEYGFTSLSSSELSASVLSKLPSGGTLGRFAQSISGAIYYIDSGLKQPITSFDTFKSMGGTSSNTYVIPGDVLNQIPNGSAI